MTNGSTSSRGNLLFSSVVFIAIMLAIGFAAAWLSPPGAWYEALQKPPFNPPAWIFAPVWTLLYVLIGIAGGIAWQYQAKGALMAWAAQAVLNGAWSLAFFRYHMMDAALAIVLAMAVMIVLFIAATWGAGGRLRVAAMLFVPYGAWVSFATLLNFELLRLN